MTRYGTICIILALSLGLPTIGAAQNPYYDHGTFPATGSLGTSAGMRAELDLIEAGFNKLPTLSGNANKIVVVNGGGTALTATDAPIPSGANLPSSPSTGGLFISTDDSTQGACDSAAGSAVSLCRWNGTSWVGLGAAAASNAWLTGATKEITWANSFANAILFGAGGTRKYAFYDDSTGGLQFNCVVAGVENDCNYIRKLAAGKYWEIQNSSGSSIGRITNDTGRLTNAIVRDEVHWPVASCQNATASAIHDLPTTNSPTATCDTGSNTQKGYLAFNDSTEQSFQDHWILPAGFTGTIDVQLRWKGANTSNAVRWCAQLIRVPDGATSDPAFPAQGAGNCVNDTAKGTTLQENLATISAVTCTSCVAGDHVYVRISRMAADAADTFVGNALLLMYGRVSDRMLQ